MASGRAAPRSFSERRARHPFNDMGREEVDDRVERFFRKTSLPSEDYALIYRGAFLALNPDFFRLRPTLASPTETTRTTRDGNASSPTARDDYAFVNAYIPRRSDDPDFRKWKHSLVADDLHVLVDEEEKRWMRREAPEAEVSVGQFWNVLKAYPPKIYWLIACCCLAAVVQGFDETAVNGAQVFYHQAFRGDFDQDTVRLGAVNGAPYALSAFMCLFNHPLNEKLGRRGVIFATCLMSFVWCLAQSLSQTWTQLFIFRLLLGLGIGLKSATIPIYASECAPAKIRGGLVMMWQMWTAFGLFLGYVSGVAFWYVGGNECRVAATFQGLPCSLNWRLMLGIAMVPPLIPMLYIYTLPESPRFLLRKAIYCQQPNEKKKIYRQAYDSLKQLNRTPLQASREMIRLYYSLEKEPQGSFFDTIPELFTSKRTQRALLASMLVMFMQQFCGVNVIAYYSTSVLQQNIYDHPNVEPQDKPDAFFYSLGFGALNWIFALPAMFLMDTLGRRSLLLLTFPFLAICQASMAGSLVNSESDPRNDLGTKGFVASMYLFCIFYSIGEGPVPFVYAAESMPLHHRDYGMGIVTSVNWAFNFLLALTWPKFLEAFKPSGSFGWYAAWCGIGWVLIFLFVRETKGDPLEGMEDIFLVPSSLHIRFAFKELRWFFNACRKLSIDDPPPPKFKDDVKAFFKKEGPSAAQEYYEMYDQTENGNVSMMGTDSASGNL